MEAVGRAVVMGAGNVWRPTLTAVLIRPRQAQPFTVPRAAAGVLALLDRARPDPVDESVLLAVLTPPGADPPPNASEWLADLLVLLESAGVVTVHPDDGPDVDL